jgi:hypothetical protein
VHVGAVLSQRNFFVEGEACGGTQRRDPAASRGCPILAIFYTI